MNGEIYDLYVGVMTNEEGERERACVRAVCTTQTLDILQRSAVTAYGVGTQLLSIIYIKIFSACNSQGIVSRGFKKST